MRMNPISEEGIQNTKFSIAGEVERFSEGEKKTYEALLFLHPPHREQANCPSLRASNKRIPIMLHPRLLVPFPSGMGPALILLRPSSEALLRARAPGARD